MFWVRYITVNICIKIMFWILVLFSFMVASAEDLPNSEQSNWPYIKNVISTKLFGKQSAIVIQQPEIPKNKSYQLIQIEGHNILINLTRLQEYDVSEKDILPKEETAMITSPEMAIIKRYLGTTSDGETLVAIEAAKNLVTSGVLDETDIEDSEYQSHEYQESSEAYSDNYKFIDKNGESEEAQGTSDAAIVLENAEGKVKSEYLYPQKNEESFEDDSKIGEDIENTNDMKESLARSPITSSMLNEDTSPPSGLKKHKPASNEQKNATYSNLDQSAQKTPREYIFTPPDNVDIPLNSFLGYLFNA